MNHYPMANWPENRSYFGVLKDVLFGKGLEHVSFHEKSGVNLTKRAQSDAEIEQDIKSELRSEPSIRASAMDVHVKNGMTTLTGTVDGDGERWLIETAVRRIVGANSLSMKLNVVAPEPGVRTDNDIAHDCEDVLAALSPQGDYAIRVMVSSGRVTLLGNVVWGIERWIAETTISDLAGVCGVNGQISVRPHSHPK